MRSVLLLALLSLSFDAHAGGGGDVPRNCRTTEQGLNLAPGTKFSGLKAGASLLTSECEGGVTFRQVQVRFETEKSGQLVAEDFVVALAHLDETGAAQASLYSFLKEPKAEKTMLIVRNSPAFQALERNEEISISAQDALGFRSAKFRIRL